MKMKHEIDNLMENVHELKLEDFSPKLESQVNGDAETELADEPKYSVEEDRKISYGVHLAVKLLGGRL